MKLQPCNSPFFDMKDTILQLDQVPTCGENFCDIWEGFAEWVFRVWMLVLKGGRHGVEALGRM
jgi:hypothetical protein